ncbi:MAG: hypothetical protein V3U80_06560 [Flavobacteriaceae bacterium]
MIRITTYFVLIFMMMISNGFAQETTFEEKLVNLSSSMDKIMDTEKALLKKDINSIEDQYNAKQITLEQAEKLKKDATKLHAFKIKEKMAQIERQAHDIIQLRVDEKMAMKEPLEEEYYGAKIKFGKNKSKKKIKKDERTHAYFSVAFGFNNLMNNGELNSIQNSNFNFGKSGFSDIGINYKTRIFKNSGLSYINYGLSFRGNRLRIKDNKYFVTTGENTGLQTHIESLKKVNFSTSQLVIPIFYELDFSKPKITTTGKRVRFKRNDSWRIGFGGFAGVNLLSTQKINYKKDGKRITINEKGDFNVNRFVYGLQGQIGYKSLSFYAKYDLNDLFKQSFTDQKNISFGVKWDL